MREQNITSNCFCLQTNRIDTKMTDSTKKLSQKEYLKKYLCGGTDDKKKKKKKLKGPKINPRTIIIDDDVDLSKLQPLDDSALDLYELNEDAPQIVGIVDDRPAALQAIEQYKTSQRWKVLDDPEGNGLQVSAVGMSRDNDDASINIQDGGHPHLEAETKMTVKPTPGTIMDDAILPSRKKIKNEDESPPRRRKKGEGESPPQRIRNNEDESPPRRRRKEDESPPRRSTKEDESPPRRRKKEDESPPRRRKKEDESPPRRRGKDQDESPPRRRRKEDGSPPRRSTKEDDESPPRRRKKEDESPPRRRRKEDESPPRRKRKEEDDSPPRRRRRDEDESPPRRKRKDVDDSPPRRRKDEDESPPRRKRSGDEFLLLNSHPKIKVEKGIVSDAEKMQKTLDGKVAGLQDARKLKKELMDLKKKEEDVFAQMDDRVSGRGATAVQRDRKTGLKRDMEREREEQLIEEKKNTKNKEKYDRWGKGMKQTEDQQERLVRDLHEMSKPLARYADDKDLESHLRHQEREGDPMLEYIRSKKADENPGKVKPRYEGSFPPNRYNIRPGHRWDGVDRSCGYEKQWFENLNARKALQEEAHKWSTSDM